MQSQNTKHPHWSREQVIADLGRDSRILDALDFSYCWDSLSAQKRHWDDAAFTGAAAMQLEASNRAASKRKSRKKKASLEGLMFIKGRARKSGFPIRHWITGRGNAWRQDAAQLNLLINLATIHFVLFSAVLHVSFLNRPCSWQYQLTQQSEDRPQRNPPFSSLWT